MSNAFEVLGLPVDADTQAVRAAYRTRVKTCHPDRFFEAEQQSRAQEQLIKLNLAYEEALRLSSQRQVGFHTVSAQQAKNFAARLYEQENYESALRQLGRADIRDDEWYYLQGRILLALKQYDSAHQSFREAVRRRPENSDYRLGAFEAAKAVKKHEKLTYRIADFAQGLIKPRKR